MKKSRYLLIALLSMILAVILTTAALAEEHGVVVDSGLCGDNLTWTLYEDGLLEISGTGEMSDYYYSWGAPPKTPWKDYSSQIYSLHLNEGLTKIGVGAFKDCENIKGELVIPDSVTMIGEGAFEGCSGFTGSLVIPNSVTTVKHNAFNGCSGFSGVLSIPNGVTVIEYGAFQSCSGFTQLQKLDLLHSKTVLALLAI